MIYAIGELVLLIPGLPILLAMALFCWVFGMGKRKK